MQKGGGSPPKALAQGRFAERGLSKRRLADRFGVPCIRPAERAWGCIARQCTGPCPLVGLAALRGASAPLLHRKRCKGGLRTPREAYGMQGRVRCFAKRGQPKARFAERVLSKAHFGE